MTGNCFFTPLLSLIEGICSYEENPTAYTLIT